MVDIWSLIYATVLLATVGFSPFLIPPALFFACWFPQVWWSEFAASTTQFQVMSVWMPIVAISVYWLNGLLLLFLDSWLRPEIFQEFKIQKTKRFNKQLLSKICKNILGGQLVILVSGVFGGWIGTWSSFGLSHGTQLPSGREMCLHLVGIILLNEVIFYYGHWLLHQKFGSFNLYTKVHKMHHEFTAPIGLVASYCHPIEMFISNIAPLTFGAFVFNTHSYVMLSWVGFAVLGTQFHHSGYRSPWLFAIEHQPNFHDYHHEKFNSNFGNIGFLDTLHGTDKEWKTYLKEKGQNKEYPLGSFILRAWAGVVVGGGFYSHFSDLAR